MTHTYWIILNIKERKRYAWWKKKNMATLSKNARKNSSTLKNAIKA